MSFQSEIVSGDPLFTLIAKLVVEHKPKSILEIGSATGLGSTQAFIAGIMSAGIDKKCKLYCLEANPERYAELVKNTAGLKFVKPINACSVPVDQMMSDEDIDAFMTKGYAHNITRFYSRETVKGWRADEIAMITSSGIQQNGIELARAKNKGSFDMVLIDGSAFTGAADFAGVSDSRAIIMDDTMDIKCHGVVTDILYGGEFELIAEDREQRNGFEAFKRRQ
jgi:predicted O-methyltransferase YrrM